jgi:[ribosomal protein S18]-alanine N-acetyltransferase
MVIGEGDATDISGVMVIMNSAFDPEYGEKWTEGQCLSSLTMQATRLFIARIGGAIAGFALCRTICDETELLMIGVHPDWQRKSIATQLLHFIIDRDRQNSRSQLFLEVRDGNPARNFYDKMGFLPIGRRKDYYRTAGQAHFDAITMALPLN